MEEGQLILCGCPGGQRCWLLSFLLVKAGSWARTWCSGSYIHFALDNWQYLRPLGHFGNFPLAFRIRRRLSSPDFPCSQTCKAETSHPSRSRETQLAASALTQLPGSASVWHPQDHLWRRQAQVCAMGSASRFWQEKGNRFVSVVRQDVSGVGFPFWRSRNAVQSCCLSKLVAF